MPRGRPADAVYRVKHADGRYDWIKSRGPQMPRPKFVLVEYAAAEILIHLEHFGPMRRRELWNSVNRDTEDMHQHVSISTISAALRLLQSIGRVHQAETCPADMRRCAYSLVRAG